MRIMQFGAPAARLALAGLAVAALTACSGTSTPSADGKPAAPEAFGPAGYQGVGPGTTKDAALAGGKLAAAPVSTLDGCTDFSWAGGPAPDKARMDAEAAAEKKAKDLNAKADALAPSKNLPANASAEEAAKAAQEDADATQVLADSAQASADLAGKREERDKAFSAAGGASFGKDGLRELGAPATAKTAEGIGAGSSLTDLQAAYSARGLKLGDNGRYQVQLAEKPGWSYEFTTTPDGKVGAVSIINATMKCA